MKFSIVSTFYNNTIEEVLKLKESILNQTYTKWEWIISDDFSNESTEHIDLLKSFTKEDKRIKYIEQKSKKEIFWNPQTYATGDAIMLIGADDWISCKTLEIFCHHFVKYPDLILITSESNIYNDNYHLKASIFLNYSYHTNSLDRIKSSTFHNWLNMGVPLTWRNIPIDFTQDIRIDNQSIINDYLIHTRLEELGKFIHLPRVFYHCKIRNNSVSRKIDDNNNYLSTQFEEATEKAVSRRKGFNMENYNDFYNSIIEDSKIFTFSDINKESTCQNISLIKIDEEFNQFKKTRFRELYFDHNIHFNKVEDDIDYYFIFVDEATNFQKLINVYRQISTYKEITILSKKEVFLQDIFSLVKNYWWFSMDNKTWIKTSK